MKINNFSLFYKIYPFYMSEKIKIIDLLYSDIFEEDEIYKYNIYYIKFIGGLNK